MAGLEQYSDPPPPIGPVSTLAKFGLQSVFPETYSAATSWIPSLSEIGSAVGLDGLAGIGGGALGGAMAAMGPAGIAYAVAQLLAYLGQSSDRRVSYGSGMGSLENGFRQGEGRSAQGLYDQFAGDRSWYGDADPSKVADLPIDFGSMSNKKSLPYYAIGGVPYQTSDLAVSSGRQIAGGQMGLPVNYEPLFNAYDPTSQSWSQGLGQMMVDKSLPVYDGPRNLPGQWDEMLDRRNRMGEHGEAQSSGDVGLEAFMNGLDPRTRQWFDMGQNTSQLYAFTGPQMADAAMFDEDTSKADKSKRIADAAGIDLGSATPFDPLTYGFGPARNFFPERTKGGLRAG